MNHGSELAMFVHHFLVLLINFVNFVISTLCQLYVFSGVFFTLLTGQTDRISLRLIWIGVVAAVVGALGLALVMLWRWQSPKKDGYLPSNQAACRSFMKFPRPAKQEMFGQFVQCHNVSTELFLMLVT